MDNFPECAPIYLHDVSTESHVLISMISIYYGWVPYSDIPN